VPSGGVSVEILVRLHHDLKIVSLHSQYCRFGSVLLSVGPTILFRQIRAPLAAGPFPGQPRLYYHLTEFLEDLVTVNQLAQRGLVRAAKAA